MTLKPRIEEIPKVPQAVLELIQESVAIDILLPWLPDFNGDGFERLLPRWRRAGVSCISLTLSAGGDDSSAPTMDWIARVRAAIARSPNVSLIRTASDIRQCHRENTLGLSFNFQDTLPIGRTLHLVQYYYELGVRQIGLAYNIRNYVGDGCAEESNAGLSRFGRQLIKELNRVGVIVDGTHAGYRTTMEAMEIGSKPFIFSHSNPMAIRPHYRSVRDDQMKSCAATGGLVGINGVGFWTGDMDATTESIFRCLEYAVELIGEDHVAIGFDYIWDIDKLFGWADHSDLLWPPYEGERMVKHNYAGPEQIVDLVASMVAHGYSNAAVKKILGENYLRVVEANWT
jgi:membrane dipeptidase